MGIAGRDGAAVAGVIVLEVDGSEVVRGEARGTWYDEVRRRLLRMFVIPSEIESFGEGVDGLPPK